ncbi:ABC transporter permease [Gracilibacillus sp. Marseille-QA3620]
MKIESLWKERFNHFLKETGKYLKYIFNGHLVFVMIILIGGAGYYYSEWVKTLTPDFPAPIIMALILGLVVTISPLTTFFRDPDIVFLLPIETRLDSYVKRSYVFSFVMQLYVLLIIQAVLTPMYMQVMGGQALSFLSLLIVLLILKAVNLAGRWFVLYDREPYAPYVDTFVRFALNGVLVYLIVKGANVLLILLVFAVLVGLCLYYVKSSRNTVLQWERLIELENGRMAAFYRIANLFTDVPKLREKITERRWLSAVIRVLSGRTKNPFSYLYARTFVRANDYFGLYMRLSIIAFLVVAFADLGWGSVFVSVLFLYMTGLQLLPIWHHHDQKMTIELYPYNPAYRKKAVMDLLTILMVIQCFFFAIGILIGGSLQLAGLSLILGLAVIVFFRMFASRKMQE